jgi:hypothetical protein
MIPAAISFVRREVPLVCEAIVRMLQKRRRGMSEALQTLERLNEAWENCKFEELPQYFDDNIVMLGPGPKVLVRGREGLVRSYVDFMTKSQLIEYHESPFRALFPNRGSAFILLNLPNAIS